METAECSGENFSLGLPDTHFAYYEKIDNDFGGQNLPSLTFTQNTCNTSLRSWASCDWQTVTEAGQSHALQRWGYFPVLAGLRLWISTA